MHDNPSQIHDLGFEVDQRNLPGGCLSNESRVRDERCFNSKSAKKLRPQL